MSAHAQIKPAQTPRSAVTLDSRLLDERQIELQRYVDLAYHHANNYDHANPYDVRNLAFVTELLAERAEKLIRWTIENGTASKPRVAA